MHQVKFFKGIESEVSELQAEVNAWLAESGANVVNMFGNIAPQTTKPEGATAGGSSGSRLPRPFCRETHRTTSGHLTGSLLLSRH